MDKRFPSKYGIVNSFSSSVFDQRDCVNIYQVQSVSENVIVTTQTVQVKCIQRVGVTTIIVNIEVKRTKLNITCIINQ